MNRRNLDADVLLAKLARLEKWLAATPFRPPIQKNAHLLAAA
jgi:hypothetical protein